MDREFRCCAGRIGRRAALELGICLALAPCLALAQTDAARERPREGDLLVAAGATPSEPLKPDDLPLDGKQTCKRSAITSSDPPALGCGGSCGVAAITEAAGASNEMRNRAGHDIGLLFQELSPPIGD
jgi:hypothetical protein